MARGLAHWAALRVFRRVMQIYFRSVEIVGTPDESVQSRLFAANHANGLVDALLVLTSAKCPISPLAKSTLWKVPGLTFLLDLAQAVPVVRRRDVPDKSANATGDMFAKVANHLADGGNILIFPEGTSHTEPKVLPMRSGAPHPPLPERDDRRVCAGHCRRYG